MTDNELEQHLRNHYRSLDPSTAPRGLALRIEDAMTRPASRWAFLGRMPAVATGIAAVAVVALVVAFRPGGLLAPVGASPSPETPTPAASATPHPSPAISPAPTPSPSLGVPGGSIPPVSTLPWTSLDLAPASGNPRPWSVVAWSGGYLALGATTGDRSPLPAWISRDGRSWTTLPEGTLGSASSVLAAPAPDGILVVTESATGVTTAWHSADGTTWSSTPAPALRFGRESDIAGGPGGIVAVLAETRNRIDVSTDGRTWRAVSLPGPATAEVQGVAAFRTGFVAVGDTGTGTGSPIAWWSGDGLAWSLATVQPHPDDGFSAVHAGGSGLVAISSTATVPGLASFWASSDGRTWSLATDPLGLWQQGEGAGSANGLFSGDGIRVLGYGIRADGQPTEYWTSLDGINWTQLTLTGDTSAATTGQVNPFLMRDGILFVGDGGPWFGSAGS